MKCPHCTTSIHESWHSNDIWSNNAKTAWNVLFMSCPQCKKEIMRLGKNETRNNLSKVFAWHQIYPVGSNRGPVPKDVPEDIAADYDEAALVLPLSAKASAALSRRCLQSVLREAGYTQKDLSKQIDAALAETDARKALPSGLHMIVDVIRNFGNFSAHKITDQTTLQIIDVEPAEAQYCLDVLDTAFDHYYVKPAQAQAVKDALNAKLAAANKPPLK